MLDVLIRGGMVADGTGNPVYPADIAIEGDEITAVEPLPGATAKRVIDATGKIVCPGFIDVHSHSDVTILANPTAESTIRQGVTTEIVGNCGLGLAPLSDHNRAAAVAQLRKYGYDGPVDWSSFGEFIRTGESVGGAENLGWLVPHGIVRAAAGVAGPDPSEAQLVAMESLVREEMEAGALGLSSGLEFEPGRSVRTPELIRLAKVVGGYSGYYASHIRNRDSQIFAALDEFLTTVRESGVKGQVSHLNVRHNTNAPEGAWHQAMATIESARREGLDVLPDFTPYVHGTGIAAAILPPWVREGGPAATAARLKDPSVRARLRTDCDRYWRFIHKGEWHRVSLLSSAEYPELCHKTFPEIAEILGQDEWDCFFDILSAAGEGIDSVWMLGRLFTEEHVAEAISHPLMILGVDGSTSRIDGPLAEQTRNPFFFAGMTHYLTYHVRERGTLRLEEAIRKMTSFPATRFGLRDRGLLRRGMKADVAVFDFDRLEDVSTIADPLHYARGVEQVFVNGVAVLSDGEHTGARPGRSLGL